MWPESIVNETSRAPLPVLCIGADEAGAMLLGWIAGTMGSSDPAVLPHMPAWPHLSWREDTGRECWDDADTKACW